MTGRDPLTLNWHPPEVSVGYGPEVTGRGSLESKIARIIGQALRDARDEGMSRANVARTMADYLGRPVSEGMLNKWSSEASEDHRIPLDAFMALARATGAYQLLGFAPAEFGLAVIASEHAEMITLHLIREKRQQLEEQERALEAKLKAAKR